MKATQIAAQLYTCRDLLRSPADIAKTLKRLRAAGYTAVQVSGMGPIAEEELKRILDGEGLECCATHEPSEVILDEPRRVVDRLARLGCHYTAYPYPSGIDLADAAVVGRWISRLNHAGAVLAAAGQTLCYHNHHLEFRHLGGRVLLDLIFEGTKAENLQGEPDTYWIHFGGGDPVAWCEKLSGRLPLLHLKDYMVDAQNNVTMCEIGAGNLNFSRIVAAAENSGCRWFIVEQDACPADPVDSLVRSYRHLTDHICES